MSTRFRVGGTGVRGFHLGRAWLVVITCAVLACALPFWPADAGTEANEDLRGVEFPSIAASLTSARRADVRIVHLRKSADRVRLGDPDHRIAVHFRLSRRAHVSIAIVQRGHVVVRLLRHRLEPAGKRIVSTWAGGGRAGRLVKNGLYRFKVRAVDAGGGSDRADTRRVRARFDPDSWEQARTFTYSVERRGGARRSLMKTFARIGRKTYADYRGWSLRGNIAFDRVAAGNGAFHLILATPSYISRFGACSYNYSCHVGSMLLINQSRWLHTSPSWTLSRRKYRSYVINHETGHWLGLGHAFCPRAGAPAPVMQQQSKSLQGCRANVWPLKRERSSVARIRDVSRWPLPAPGLCTIAGTDRRDRLIGSGQGDSICGFGARDVLRGRADADRISGGSGRDKLRGGGGRDLLIGGGGADSLDGGSGGATCITEPSDSVRHCS